MRTNDKLMFLSGQVQELNSDMKNITGRVIRLETIVEIAEKQRFLVKEII